MRMLVCNSFIQVHECVCGCNTSLSPIQVNVGSYLQLLCLAENMRTDARDVSSLLHLNGCDIRQSLLHLQFWSRSTGGRKLSRPLPDSAPTGEGRVMFTK